MFLVIFIGGFCLSGCVFVGVGYQLKCRDRQKREQCIGKTWGRIVDMKMTYGKHKAIYPVYEFMVGDQRIVQESHVGSSHCPYTIGEAVTICYDPYDYSLSYIEGEQTQIWLSRFFTAFGIMFMIVGLIGGTIIGLLM